MQKPDPLIRTKLRRPFSRSEQVPRPRLQDRIAQGLRGPLTLITAPAGFGKTTLVSSCAACDEMPMAWLSLDKNDNQVGRFMNYLVAALQEADGQIGAEAAQILAATLQAAPEAILTSLVNDLDAAGREIAMVLDDYQLIHSQAVHDAVTFLLDHAPPTLHLVLATRSDPPLPLARLRARGKLVELRAADLRFTESEAAQFLNDVMGLRLDAGAVAALDERTEGWIAGLQMAALSMRDRKDVRGFIEGFSGTNRYILDYLLEEVLATQPPEIQHFLLCTSILERLAAPLCDALLEVYEAAGPEDEGVFSSESRIICQSLSTLAHLERQNLFLAPLDDERNWYRYHHLFADLLRARLHQARSDSIPRLHIRAAGWLEQEGFITEAIQHLFAAQEPERAADLIERHGPARLAQNDPSVFQMADHLPPEMLVARPKIGLYQAWLLIVQGHIHKVIPLLADLAGQLAGASADSGQRWMHTFVASAQAFLAPPPDHREADYLPDSRLLDEIPAEEPILRNAADYLYVMALARRDDLDRSVELAVNCIQRERLRSGTEAIPTLAPFLTRLHLMMGRLQAAASLCREFLDTIEERNLRFVYASGNMKIDLGEVLYEWNHLEEAEQRIRDGLLANETWRNIMTDGFGLVALTRVLLAKRDYAGAMHIVEEFETTMQSRSRPHEFEEDFHTLRVRVQLASGELESPSRWADQIQSGEDFALYPEPYRLTLARVRLAQGRYAEVESLLAGVTPEMTTGSQISRQLECHLLLAAACVGQGRRPEALDRIESALALAEPEGYVRVFLDAGEPARELLTAYLRSDAPTHDSLRADHTECLFPPRVRQPAPAHLSTNRADRSPLGARAGSAPAHGPGHDQSGDRPAAHRGPGHYQGPYLQHLPQTRCRQPHRGGGPRPRAWYSPLRFPSGSRELPYPSLVEYRRERWGGWRFMIEPPGHSVGLSHTSPSAPHPNPSSHLGRGALRLPSPCEGEGPGMRVQSQGKPCK